MAGLLYYLKTQTEFRTSDHYNTFIEIIEHASKKSGCSVFAFCLMPTHYHLLLEITPGLLKMMILFMHKSAAKHLSIHRRKQAPTPLFGDPLIYAIEKNYYAAELSFFIHAVPFLSGICCDPVNYEWSSLSNYLKTKKKYPWINPQPIWSQISYRYFFAYIDYRRHFYRFINDESWDFSEKMQNSIVGSRSFHAQMSRSLPDSESSGSSDATILDDIASITNRYFFNNARLKHLADAYLSYLLSGFTNKELGVHLGDISAPRVSQLVARARKEIHLNNSFALKLKKIEKKVLTKHADF